MKEFLMAKCEVCGNDYDKSFELIAAGARHTFDSFECAIQAIAPICEHCKCRVIGHGVKGSYDVGSRNDILQTPTYAGSEPVGALSPIVLSEQQPCACAL